MPLSREVHLVARPSGALKADDFAVVETQVADAGDRQVLVQNLYMSVDPYMRPQLNGVVPLNSPLPGAAVGRVVQSKSPAFAPGDVVSHFSGFRELHLSNGEDLERVRPVAGLPLTVHMHALGMTGFTAYGGLLEVGRLREGEEVFVSAAAGAVGSVAAQVARIKGCRVIGSAGSPEKLAWLRDVARIHAAIDYRATPIDVALEAEARNGLDVYFDNVGGAHLDAALQRMNLLGRIPVCGMISGYDTGIVPIRNLAAIIYKRVMLRGFLMSDFPHLRSQFEADMAEWLLNGEVRYAETILEGIATAPAAMVGLMDGSNIGKMLVKIAA